ncbi:MAG: hypothetical protein J1E06_00020 [Acutalibacter sp.]|nr:hypothetical protein [Acutalibacter sp.]
MPIPSPSRAMSRTAEEDIRTLLGIPDYYGIVNAVSLGMKKNPTERQELQSKVRYETY